MTGQVGMGRLVLATRPSGVGWCLVGALLLAGCSGATLQTIQYIDRPDYQYRVALRFMEGNQWDAAARELRKAIAKDDGYAPAWIALGLIEAIIGDQQEAVRMMARGKELMDRGIYPKAPGDSFGGE